MKLSYSKNLLNWLNIYPIMKKTKKRKEQMRVFK